MNKKQLRVQNDSFLAELERKSKEIEILNIRLEDSEQKAEALANEKVLAENLAEELKAENNELCEKVASLETALADATAKLEQNEAVISALQKAPAPAKVTVAVEEVVAKETVEEEITTKETTSPITEIDFEIEKQIEQVAALANGAEVANGKPEAQAQDEPDESETPVVINTAKSENSPTSDFLRDYGAKIIARVTVATAEVMARAVNSNDDVSKSLKTLALGKNESFKYQIMELSRQKQDPQKAVQEMDLLAEETIVYLKSI